MPVSNSWKLRALPLSTYWLPAVCAEQFELPDVILNGTSERSEIWNLVCIPIGRGSHGRRPMKALQECCRVTLPGFLQRRSGPHPLKEQTPPAAWKQSHRP